MPSHEAVPKFPALVSARADKKKSIAPTKTLGCPSGVLCLDMRKPMDKKIKGRRRLAHPKLSIRILFTPCNIIPLRTKETMIRPPKSQNMIWTIECTVCGFNFILYAFLLFWRLCFRLLMADDNFIIPEPPKSQRGTINWYEYCVLRSCITTDKNS